MAGRRGIRVPTVVDGYTRECLAIEVGVSIGTRRLTRVLEFIIVERGARTAVDPFQQRRGGDRIIVFQPGGEVWWPLRRREGIRPEPWDE